MHVGNFPSFATRTRQHGFTLVELSIALVVIGIVVAGGLSMTTSMVDRQAYVQTGNQMDEIEKALSAFVTVNKRLPCPAVANIPVESDAQFGKEKPGCASPSGVAIGMLPVRTLGLRDRMAADEYGNRYTYAVTSNLTTNQFETDDGRIIIKDGSNHAIINNAAYAIVSHGGDSKGAYRYETANQVVTCNGGKDSENCNGDATFVNTRFNRGSVAGNWFDDTVRFRQKQLILLNDISGNELWKENGQHIYNTNAGNVGIGTGAPIAKLSVNALDMNGLEITTQNSAHAALINSRLNESGLTILTNASDPADSLRIDHVGENGTGARVLMNNKNSTGVYINLMQENSTGILIDAATPQSSGMVVNVNNASGQAIMATNNAAAGSAYAINGATKAINGKAIYGYAQGNSSHGLSGKSDGTSGYGVYGEATNISGRGVVGLGSIYGVYGRATANNGTGVYGETSTPNSVGVYGRNSVDNGFAIYGYATGNGTTYGVYGHSTTGYGIWCQANFCGGQKGWNETSDARLKDHVVTLDDSHGLEAIRKLRPVTYSWRDTSKQQLGTQLGFIAQEVETILPEVVSTGGNQEIDLGEGMTETVTNAKSMMYATITVPLVRAVQQLADALDALAGSVKDVLARLSGMDTKIAALETDNTALKADNAALTKRLDAIEAQLAH